MVPIPGEWGNKPPSVDEIPERVVVLESDAGFKEGVTGVCTVIKSKGKEYSPIEYSARSKGPIEAELTAVKKGLERVNLLRRDFDFVVVYTDCDSAFFFLSNLWEPNKDYIVKVIGRIRELERKIGAEIVYVPTKTKYIRRVDRRAGKKRKIEEAKVAERVQERVHSVEKATIRGHGVIINEVNGEYFAMSKKNGFPPGYKVGLYPASCECPWWQNRWGNKPLKVQMARALPCKHICALAGYLEEDIFDVFNKQIYRPD